MYDMRPTAKFRLSVTNICLKHDLHEPINIEDWCSTYRLFVLRMVSKYDLQQLKNFYIYPRPTVYLCWKRSRSMIWANWINSCMTLDMKRVLISDSKHDIRQIKYFVIMFSNYSLSVLIKVSKHVSCQVTK